MAYLPLCDDFMVLGEAISLLTAFSAVRWFYLSHLHAHAPRMQLAYRATFDRVIQ